MTGIYSYEQLANLIRELGLGQDSLNELYKRAIFNIVGRNQDDHTKNFGFVMDKNGKFDFSPAFDMTYSYDPSGKWTSMHQIKLNQKQDDFTINDLIQFAKHCNITSNKSRKIIQNTIDVFKKFETLAIQYDLPVGLLKTIKQNLRLDIN